LRRYPRETWAGHANLGELARFWLQRHELFRQLDEVIRSGVETALEEGVDAAAFKPWLSRHLGWSLWQLEQHHQVEDHHYFPLFRRAEPRLAPGFELSRAIMIPCTPRSADWSSAPPPCSRAKHPVLTRFAPTSPTSATVKSISGAR
jgi:hypothetical protein